MQDSMWHKLEKIWSMIKNGEREYGFWKSLKADYLRRQSEKAKPGSAAQSRSLCCISSDRDLYFDFFLL
jgi:hypothetical protein